MAQDILVKKSGIEGKGVFAGRDFRKGEVVLEWHATPLTKQRADSLSPKDRNYLYKIGRKHLFMQEPERYVNHSCEPNTAPDTNSGHDVAVREIRKGEEITSDYGKGNPVEFECRCGAKTCRGFISTQI